MNILISAVGDTDPIRNFHDGSLLHIARVYKPDRIVLIHSLRSYKKHDRVLKALNSIPDYRPEISVDENILKDSEVFLFDKMYETLSKIIKGYVSDENMVILNLTSATPQIISAMFSINRILDFNVKAVQVSTPVNASNENIKHDNQEDINALIQTNQDNRPDFVKRTIEDNGQKFSLDLLRRKLKVLIDNYDYQAAYHLMCDKVSYSKTRASKIRKSLMQIVETIETQSMPEKIKKSNLSGSAQKALNSFISIKKNYSQGNIAEALIRIKSLTEFIIENYLDLNYPDLIKRDNGERPFLNKEKYPQILDYFKQQARNRNDEYHESYLSLPSLEEILEFLEPENTLLKNIRQVSNVNGVRNKVAHSLDGFDRNNINTLKVAIKAVKNILLKVFRIDDKWLDFYDDFNKELEELI